MRIPSYRNNASSRSDQTMTPMIDVVFLLLIFFVCASVGQVRESVLPAELSAGSLASLLASQPTPPPPLGEVWLKVLRTSDGKSVVEMNEHRYTHFSQLEETLRNLAELAPEIPVILDIESDVVLEDMIHVFDTCRAAGFESISFAADAGKLKPPAGPGE